MRQLADGVWQLSGFPRNALNVYLLEDVLIDAGTYLDRGRIVKELAGQAVTAHALTHAHFDHYGASRLVCARFGIPLWCGARDVEMVQAGKMLGPGGRVLPAAPSCQVTRALHEGDGVAGFSVLDTPGHSPGHVSYWRESDCVLVCGDVIWGTNPFINAGPPREPFPFLTPTRNVTASPPAGWRRSNRLSSASATARRFEIPPGLPRSSRSCPADFVSRCVAKSRLAVAQERFAQPVVAGPAELGHW